MAVGGVFRTGRSVAHELCGGPSFRTSVTALGAAFEPDSDGIRDSPASDADRRAAAGRQLRAPAGPGPRGEK